MNATGKKMSKLTILVENDVYKGLHKKIGRGNISKYINDTVKPFVTDDDAIVNGYKEMAKDIRREKETKEVLGVVKDFNTPNLW